MTIITLVGAGIILTLSRGGVTLPFRLMLRDCMDFVVNTLSKKTQNTYVLESIRFYLLHRDEKWCMKCVGFWVGVLLHLWMPLTDYFLLDGFFFVFVGWFLEVMETWTISWSV